MTQTDYQKLSSLIDFADPVTAELLQEELDRAAVVLTDQLPQDVVTMNSKVEFKDLDSGEDFVMTLVFPENANIKENKVSILAPVGAALIGLRVGQTMSWPTPRGG
ncbi:MAG: nucleoside diphosphate kinase regulator, partial [Pseudobdellovibrionaceae bacterium]